MFDIKKGKRLTKQDMIEGNTLFIGSTALNNGITASIGQKPIFKENCISISYNGSVGEAFYQNKPFWASDDINVLYLKKHELNELLANYFCTTLRKAGKAFGYTQKWNLARMTESNIKLPVLLDGTPNYDYMETYIKSMEKIVIANVVKWKDKEIKKTKELIA